MQNSVVEQYSLPLISVEANSTPQHFLAISLDEEQVNYGGWLNGKLHTGVMTRGVVSFRAAGDSASGWWDRTANALILSFDRTLLTKVFQEDHSFAPLELVSILTKEDFSLAQLVTALHSDAVERHPYGLMRSESILAAIATHLATGYASVPSRFTAGLNVKAVSRTLEYIAAHLGTPLSVSMIAAAVGVSPYYLNRCFRKAVGQSLWSYVLQERVLKSQALMMRRSERSLLEVSGCVGFESYSQFVSAFRRYTGLTPSEFRKQTKA